MYEGVRRFLCSLEIMLEMLEYFLLNFPKQGVYYLLKNNFICCCLENMHSAKVKDFIINLFDPSCIKYNFCPEIQTILAEYANKIGLPLFLARSCFKYNSLVGGSTFIKGFIHPKIEKACEVLINLKEKHLIQPKKYKFMYQLFYLDTLHFDSFCHEKVFGLDALSRVDHLNTGNFFNLYMHMVNLSLTFVFLNKSFGQTK